VVQAGMVNGGHYYGGRDSSSTPRCGCFPFLAGMDLDPGGGPSFIGIPGFPGFGPRRTESYAQISQTDDHEDKDGNGKFYAEQGEEIEIDEDVYGVAIFSIIHDGTEILSDKNRDSVGLPVNVYRMVFAIVLLLTNFVLQVSMLVLAYQRVVAPSVHKVQSVYKQYRENCYEEGIFRAQVWQDYDEVDKRHLCHMVFGSFWFIYGILFLWWGVMITEVRKNQRLVFIINKLGRQNKTMRAGDPDEMFVVGAGKEGCDLIVRLTPLVRMFLYGILLLPKCVINLVLLVLGTMWLAATDKFEDLILNAVALEFVISIDELLFRAFIPVSVKQAMLQVRLWNQNDGEPGKFDPHTIVLGLVGSTGWYIVCLIGVPIFLTFGQTIPFIGVLPGFAYDIDCTDFWEKGTQRLCHMDEECFSTG